MVCELEWQHTRHQREQSPRRMELADDLLPLDALDFGYYEDCDFGYLPGTQGRAPTTDPATSSTGVTIKRERDLDAGGALDIEEQLRQKNRKICWSPDEQPTPEGSELFSAGDLVLPNPILPDENAPVGKTRSPSIDLKVHIRNRSRSLSFDLMQQLLTSGMSASKLLAGQNSDPSQSRGIHAPGIPPMSADTLVFIDDIETAMNPTGLNSSSKSTKTRSRPRSNKGSRQCLVDGCTKNGQGASKKCIAHGGGRRCTFPACTKSAQGSTDLCKAHGGGKRCEVVSCTKSARGATGLCKAHGGGRRCGIEGCGKCAANGSYKCINHGGGRKCCEPGCTKSAAGSTAKCKAHGGGLRCLVDGCTKSAQGAAHKCIAHGGGRRCSVPTCNKSAQGATDRCKAHGGGRRCKEENCGKSRFRSLEYCKAHGGPTVELILSQEREKVDANKRAMATASTGTPTAMPAISDDELF